MIFLVMLAFVTKIRTQIKTSYLSHFKRMATNHITLTKYEYVKGFEREDKCLPNSWIVVRIDGRSFSKFSEQHNFEKPNDKRSLNLMTKAAASVMKEIRDVSLAYGQSDEYSFLLRKDTNLFNRRSDKIMSVIDSIFTASFVYHWSEFFADTKLLYPPSFDSRIVVYPSEANIRDYFSWRQVDVHINNLYNSTFWALVKAGNTKQKAQELLKGTSSADKNEILFKQFGVNYNSEPAIFKKGTTLIRKLVPSSEDGKLRHCVIPLYGDIVGDEFWKENLEILGLKSLSVLQKPLTTSEYHVVNINNTAASCDSDDENGAK